MTPDQIRRLGASASTYADGLCLAADRFKLHEPLVAAHFLAQCAHESGGFRFVTENLNYSAAGLRAIFGKYFKTAAYAAAYARKPEKIANRVYASRMGNGDEASGDGWRYRGRGLIQLTGKNNYVAAQASLGCSPSIVTSPDEVASPVLACLTAAWFWDKNKLSAIALRDDIEAVTKAVNGGYHGLEDRKAWLAKAKAALT